MSLEKAKNGCPFGKEIAAEIEAGGNAEIETRLQRLKQSCRSSCSKRH